MLSSKILFFIQLNQWAYMVLLEDVVDREIYFLEGKFLFPSFRRFFVNGFFLYVLTGNWSSIYNPSIVSLQECITQTSMRMCGYGWERDGILQNSLCLLVLVTFLKFMYMCVEVIVTNWWFVFKTQILRTHWILYSVALIDTLYLNLTCFCCSSVAVFLSWARQIVTDENLSIRLHGLNMLNFWFLVVLPHVWQLLVPICVFAVPETPQCWVALLAPL